MSSLGNMFKDYDALRALRRARLGTEPHVKKKACPTNVRAMIPVCDRERYYDVAEVTGAVLFCHCMVYMLFSSNA